jgi:hypothetical protein
MQCGSLSIVSDNIGLNQSTLCNKLASIPQIYYILIFQIGPLRCWPGGLCLSRSIGDVDVGEFIVPIPYVKQVKVDFKNYKYSTLKIVSILLTNPS